MRDRGGAAWVRLSARRTGNTPTGFGLYRFQALPTPEPAEAAVPWRCDACRWWEPIPDFAHDPSGRRGMCLRAEMQDATDAEQDGVFPLRRFLADDGLATTADFGCLDWQAAVVPAHVPWLEGASDVGWRFPGVGLAQREPPRGPDGGSRPGGTVFTFRPPALSREGASLPNWACGTCRWFGSPTSDVPSLRVGYCAVAAKADLIPTGDAPPVFLKAFAGDDGLVTAVDFGCAMWDDERYAGLPTRDWGADAG